MKRVWGMLLSEPLANFYNVSWTSFIHVFTILLTRGDIYKGSRYLGDNDTKNNMVMVLFQLLLLLLCWCTHTSLSLFKSASCPSIRSWMTDLTLVFSTSKWLILHWSSLPLNDWSYIDLLYLWMTDLTLVFSTSEWLILHWSSLPLNDWSYIDLLYIWI